MSSEPRVIMFAPLCFPPGNAEAMVNAKLVRAMRAAGWHVDVITDPGVERWYPVDAGAWQDVAEVVHPVVAVSTPCARVGAAAKAVMRTGLLGRLPSWAVPAFEAARALARRRPYDFILSRAVPDTAHFPALMLQRHTRLPWIANWNDPQPAAKALPPYGEGPSAKMTAREGRFYRAIAARCAWHTFPCERLRRYMCGYLPGALASRSSVIPHVALAHRSVPLTDTTRGKTFTICHAGSLRPPRDVRTLLDGTRLFMQDAGSCAIRLRFVAGSSDGILQTARALGLGDIVEICPGATYKEVSAVLASADVLVIIEAHLDEGIFFPSKFVDYIQAGRPILALSPPRGTLSDILGANGGGIAVDAASAPAVAAALTVLHDHWKRGTLDSAYSSRCLFSMFSEQNVLETYRELFDRLSGGSSS